MADKPKNEFGKRKPVSVPVAPPPAKRSGHVALLLMGTVAVGSTAYALMPSRTCEPAPNPGSPNYQQTSTECTSRGSSSSSHSSGGSGSSSRSSYYSNGSSSSNHSSSGTSDSGSHSSQRGGFGSFGHAVGFSGG